MGLQVASAVPETERVPPREFTVPGRPQAKGRPRFHRATGRAYQTSDVLAYADHARYAYRANHPTAEPLTGPVTMTVRVCHGRPKSHFRTDGTLNKRGEALPLPVRHPDIENVAGAIADAMNGYAYLDDRQIVRLLVTREWALVDHVAVRITDASITAGHNGSHDA